MRNKAWRKNIAFLLVIAMMLTIMPVTVFAEGDSILVAAMYDSEGNEVESVSAALGDQFKLTAKLTTPSQLTTVYVIWEPTGEGDSTVVESGNAEIGYTYTSSENFTMTEGLTQITAVFTGEKDSELADTTISIQQIVVLEASKLGNLSATFNSYDSVVVTAGTYDGKIIIPEGKELVIDGDVHVTGLTITDGTLSGKTDKETDHLFVTVDGDGTPQKQRPVELKGASVSIENVDLDVSGINFNYLIGWSAKNLYVNNAKLSAHDNQANGSGLFVGSAAETLYGENSDFNFSGNGLATKTKRNGIWADGDGNPNVTFDITGGTFKLNDNGLNGFQGTTGAKPTFIFTNTDVEACRNGAYGGLFSKGDGFSYGYITLKNTDGNEHSFKVNGNSNNGVDGGSGSNAAFDADGYTIEANNNGKYGLSISKLNGEADESTIKNCTVTASGNKTTGIKNTQNLTVENSVMHVQNSKNAHDATYSSNTNRITTKLTGQNVIALATSDSENGMDSNFKYTSSWGDKTPVIGTFQIEGGSLQADQAIDYGMYTEVGAYPTKMSANPVNENGAALYRFDLHQDQNMEVGQLSEQSKRIDRSFVYYDNGNLYEYGFRFNQQGEDLDVNAAGNAYVWTPVSVLHYDATEGIINNLGTATWIGEDGNVQEELSRYAGDLTIYGNSLNLAEKMMPTAEKDDEIFRGWYAADDEEEAAEIAASAKTNDDFLKLYALLNTEFTAASKVSADLTDVAKAQEEKTIYAKWAAAKIEGTVFHDTETKLNHIFDAGEAVFAGIEISLKDSAGTVVATTTTDENGHYEFYLDQVTDQENGDTYTVELAAYPDGMSKVCDIKDAEQGNKFAGEKASATVNVKQGDMKTANAGFYQTGMIEGYVFEDAQNDDIARDSIYVAGTDKALADVEVQLYKMSHDSNEYFFVDETVTDATGHYQFNDLIPGERYFVYVKRPEAYNTNCVYAYNQENLDGNRFSVSTVVTGENGVALYCSDIISIVANNTERVNAGFYITERDPETPVIPTTPGDGGDDTWTPSDPTPSNPSTEIPDTDVPLAEPDVAVNEPDIEIEEPEVPLSDVPGEALEIDDEQVPLGDAPKTGDTAPTVAFAGLMAAAVVGLVITRRKFN